MREMVYEQWLHANLREVVSRPCIPVSVVEQQTTQISGQFIVQVFMLDTFFYWDIPLMKTLVPIVLNQKILDTYFALLTY